MNSPPASIQRRDPPGSPPTTARQDRRPSLTKTTSCASPSSSSKSQTTKSPAKSPAIKSPIIRSPAIKPPALKTAISKPHYFSPPSPASTTSAIAVASANDVSLVQSIQPREYAPEESDDTRSLTESIRQHVIDGGLRYHAYHAGQYLFPNDENEQMREELKHNLTAYLCDGRLVYAPILDLLEEGAEVLDLGEFLALT